MGVKWVSRNSDVSFCKYIYIVETSHIDECQINICFIWVSSGFHSVGPIFRGDSRSKEGIFIFTL